MGAGGIDEVDDDGATVTFTVTRVDAPVVSNATAAIWYVPAATPVQEYEYGADVSETSRVEPE